MVLQTNTTKCFHGGALYGIIGDDFGDIDKVDSVIDADVLDAWFSPSPNAIDALSKNLAWSLRCSPPVAPHGVERAIQHTTGIFTTNLLCGAGSSTLIFLALRELLDSKSRVLILDPTYGEYTHVLENVIGCRYDTFELKSERDFKVDLNELFARIYSGGYDLVVLVNPNNPSGQLIPRDDLIAMIKQIPDKTTVWIDEAYIDYAGKENSLASFATSVQNLIVCKSLSKVLALSGLRVAYLTSNRKIIDNLKRLTPPWSLSLPAQIVLLEALQDVWHYERCYQLTHQFRSKLSIDLEKLGFKPKFSVANFVLVDYPEHLPISKMFLAACAKQNLLMRNVSSMGRALSEHCFRVAVKDETTNKRMIEIINQVVRSIES